MMPHIASQLEHHPLDANIQQALDFQGLFDRSIVYRHHENVFAKLHGELLEQTVSGLEILIDRRHDDKVMLAINYNARNFLK